MTQKLSNSKLKDNSSKIIFGNPELCAQFLRDYVNIPMLKNVQAEDIEDVTNRYVHMFTEERNSDVVKRLHIKGGERSFFLVSLIEHKANVDYNVVMQILRYMVFIWEDYEKEMEKKQKGISKTKDFQYPPILPIIFYDGAVNWTAATQLKERIFLGDVLTEYIPDFNCLLVQLKDYSNTELLKYKNELSIIMMINKLQEAADFKLLSEEIPPEYMESVTADSPEYLLDIISQVIEILLSRINLPTEEVSDFVGQVKERNMGELLSHFKGYDIQATRREEREKTIKEMTEQITQEVTDKVRQEITDKVNEQNIQKLILSIKDLTASKESAIAQLKKQYQLSENEAIQKIVLYWNT